jgi:hypothetical protein
MNFPFLTVHSFSVYSVYSVVLHLPVYSLRRKKVKWADRAGSRPTGDGSERDAPATACGGGKNPEPAVR